MPTKERVRGSVIELGEKITDIGYEVTDFIGPVAKGGEEVSEDELEEGDEAAYYLLGTANDSKFYIRFRTDQMFASIVYPMDVLYQIADYLDENEVDLILDEPIEWGDVSEEAERIIYSKAVQRIIGNTDGSEFYRSSFNLSAYGSTSLVEYRQSVIESGFPQEFQCHRALFPYTENMSLAHVDSRVHSVIIAGERARRYAEYAFKIDKEGKDPSEYELRCMI